MGWVLRKARRPRWSPTIFKGVGEADVACKEVARWRRASRRALWRRSVVHPSAVKRLPKSRTSSTSIDITSSNKGPASPVSAASAQRWNSSFLADVDVEGQIRSHAGMQEM